MKFLIMTAFAVAASGQTTTKVDYQTQLKNRPFISVQDAPYNAKGDGSTNDYAAIATALAAAGKNRCVFFPAGTYAVGSAVSILNYAPCIDAAPGVTRIKYTGAGHVTNVLTWDCTLVAYCHGGSITNMILDGGSAGGATNGLQLKSVISASVNVRVTNVSGSGISCGGGGFCQQIDFSGSTISSNQEAFTTTPVNGILFVDGFSHSANVLAMNIDHVSGSGVKSCGLINSDMSHLVSQGNGAYGIDFAACATNPNIGNHFPGAGDLEVNTSGDIHLAGGAASTGLNTFTGVNAGFGSPGNFLTSSQGNVFIGGSSGGITMDSNSTNNVIIGNHMYGAGAAVTTSYCNTILGVRNESTGAYTDSYLCSMTGQHRFAGPSTQKARLSLITTGSTGVLWQMRATASLGMNIGVDSSQGQVLVWNMANDFKCFSATDVDPFAGAVQNCVWQTSTGNWGFGNFMASPAYTFHIMNAQAGQSTTLAAQAGDTQNTADLFKALNNAGTTIGRVTAKGVWSTAQSANTDQAGALTIGGGGTITYSFSGSYSSGPICTASAAHNVQATTSFSTLTLTGTAADVATYICIPRN
jgi:hypothetical protein